MSSQRVDRVTDPESGVEAALVVVRGDDGAGAAVEVELLNPRDHDIVLRVNSETSAFIALTVTDQHGALLSTPARKFDSSEQQRYTIVTIAPGAASRWRVPLSAQLPLDAIPPHRLHGRLVVTATLLFARSTHGDQPSDDEFRTSVVTLYDMDVLFTRESLREAD